jgi:hydroxymethylpyrimidine pyrophosphatase-like HAD family hydrolase
MTADQILAAIGLIGFGGLLKSGVDFLIASRKARQDAKHTLKETRYKAIILLCYALVYYDREKTTLIINRPDINSIDRLKNEVHAEFINMSLFGSDKVILEMKQFIHQQNSQTLNDLAIAMRKDLYGIRTSLKGNHFDL